MIRNGKRLLLIGVIFILLFVLWTLLIQTIDVQVAGQTEAEVGFATLNCCFHKFTGVHMSVYYITDWLGLLPVFICMVFAVLGLTQLVSRKSLIKVDFDILLLGIYYVIVIFCYLVFEMVQINYRPILIEGFREASYPSSTTLLVLSVMPTLIFQINRRLKNLMIKKIIIFSVMTFSIFMVIGRLISGVHWFTDIVGSVLLSAGMFCVYKAIVLIYNKEN
ncbi:MAG: phosphatase PAP2 family protein [Ruminococcaceae bacterium]|nr:phosphatase PAP2 family protein [Oscillospiraceae bacterium]